MNHASTPLKRQCIIGMPELGSFVAVVDGGATIKVTYREWAPAGHMHGTQAAPVQIAVARCA